jgi:hypothetical protein
MTTREQFRAIIAPIVAEQAGQPRKVIRKALRAARPPRESMPAYHYKVWCEECAIALRDRSRRGRHKPLAPSAVIPSMRDWAARHGLLEVRAVLDVDDEKEEPASGGGGATRLS